MKFITFREGGQNSRPGLLTDKGILDLSGFGSLAEVIQGGAEALAKVESAEKAAAHWIPAESVTLLAPLQSPPRIFCIGLNYRDHAIESKMEIPKLPTVFLKLTAAIANPGEPIRLPSLSKQPDYEAEFALVIGKRGKHISPDKWQDHVFGYTILNDVSARDIQLSTSQWTMGKSFDTFCPIGPAIVTKDEIADPHELSIQLSIDGETLQKSNTRELIFKAPELIAYLSSITALEPGDIISTGTPAGVGLGRNPQRWLRPGETVTIEIEGLGKLTNPVVAGE
ncbi:fumarylacetoacetate hydrolase family protein [Paracidobacterium acidisoli]|uniref:FAA hydrolase family protein n=1 Tax=Paracidobacterium acidisoli TaxID=2303751 RepID=A0A372IUE0_9BACT|nr:fumarylacetoacetate hydrolase family protein [Paracidobacterium acidisoli]MBT9329875.1 fumarylacetoacetate hydrolase family protein [Paracidobacterium acidisoli]